jgi:hypothetical protein
MEQRIAGRQRSLTQQLLLQLNRPAATDRSRSRLPVADIGILDARASVTGEAGAGARIFW